MFYPKLNLKYKAKGDLTGFLQEKSSYPKLENMDPGVWFKRTEYHVGADQHELALWTLCVGSCLLFKQELRNRDARLDIVDQIGHQFEAYVRESKSKI
jgi:hypothetical protein